jgi:CheY-like chemotaxis protein
MVADLAQESAIARAQPGAKRILLVDDDRDLTEMIREYLEPEGFAVDVAHSGDGLAAGDYEAHDLVLLDVMLPGVSGLELLKQLRQRSGVPVILLTARDGDTAWWASSSAPTTSCRSPSIPASWWPASARCCGAAPAAARASTSWWARSP